MKTTNPRAWQLHLKESPIMSALRQHPLLRRAVWIIVLVSMVCIFLIAAYVYPLRHSAIAACNFFASGVCKMYVDIPSNPSRPMTDDEIYSRVVIRDILNTPMHSKIPKIACFFLTPGSLPFEKLWHRFFQASNEDRFSIYVHASRKKYGHASPYFFGRDIRSDEVGWGKISMVDAEKRLLANALRDPDNQHYVLLSDSCVPLHNFDFLYNYLMFTNVSFIDCFVDPGPHGTGRYSDNMLPEVEMKDFRKGSQVIFETNAAVLESSFKNSGLCPYLQCLT